MMNKRVPKSFAHVSQCQYHTIWYRAMTIAERAVLLREASLIQALSSPVDDEGAQQRLQRWKEEIPFNRGNYFAQRLALDGLTENDMLALLATSPEALQACVSAPPLWLQTLINAFETSQSEFGLC